MEKLLKEIEKGRCPKCGSMNVELKKETYIACKDCGYKMEEETEKIQKKK